MYKRIALLIICSVIILLFSPHAEKEVVSYEQMDELAQELKVEFAQSFNESAEEYECIIVKGRDRLKPEQYPYEYDYFIRMQDYFKYIRDTDWIVCIYKEFDAKEYAENPKKRKSMVCHHYNKYGNCKLSVIA